MTPDDVTDPLRNIAASAAYSERTYGAPAEARALARHRGPDIVHEPTPGDWERYNATVEAISAIAENYPGYVDYEIDPPRTSRKPGEYTETEDEWVQRARTQIFVFGIPENLDRVLSIAEYRKLGLPTKGHWMKRPRFSTGGPMHYQDINVTPIGQEDA